MCRVMASLLFLFALTSLYGNSGGQGQQDQPKKDAAPAGESKIQKRSYDFKDAGKSMDYFVFVPSKYAKDKKTPLMVALHGLFSTPQMILGYKGLTDLAEKHGYIVAAPMGYSTTGWYGANALIKG